LSKRSESPDNLRFFIPAISLYNSKFVVFSCFFLWFLFAGKASFSDEKEAESSPVYIDSVEIDNNNIFSLDSAKYDYWIYRLANKLHIKTKKHIIERELLIKKGDIYSERLALESERNLRSLSYLWNAKVELYRSGDSLNILRVTTADSWTMLAGFSISRNSEEVSYHFRFEELNLLGLGQSVALHYYIREFREDYGRLSFTEMRLLGSRHYLNLYYDGNPEVGEKGLSIGKPFYSLDSRIQYSIAYSATDRRRDNYGEGGVVTSWEQISGDWLRLANYYRFGSYHNKIVAGLNYEYRDIGPTDTLVIEKSPNNVFSRDSLYWAITPEFGVYNLEYIGTTRINTFRTTEDILLEKGGSVEIGWTFDASNHHNIYKSIALAGNFHHYIKSNLFFAGIKQTRWFKGKTTYRKALNLSIKYYNNYIKWLTPMFRVVYTEDIPSEGAGTLYLGENNGLRGYPRNYTTGERRLIVNVENRFFSGIEILSVDLGAVQFVDIGRCWAKDEGVRLKDFYWSVGFGLRLSAERISNARLMRLDLAYAGELNDWQFSFGVGHYIN